MEVAARLMTFKTPEEAVQKHSAELNPRVLETIQRAADAAKASGNQPYHDRLASLAAVVRSELILGPERKTLSVTVQNSAL